VGRDCGRHQSNANVQPIAAVPGLRTDIKTCNPPKVSAHCQVPGSNSRSTRCADENKGNADASHNGRPADKPGPPTESGHCVSGGKRRRTDHNGRPADKPGPPTESGHCVRGEASADRSGRVEIVGRPNWVTVCPGEASADRIASGRNRRPTELGHSVSGSGFRRPTESGWWRCPHSNVGRPKWVTVCPHRSVGRPKKKPRCFRMEASADRIDSVWFSRQRLASVSSRRTGHWRSTQSLVPAGQPLRACGCRGFECPFGRPESLESGLRVSLRPTQEARQSLESGRKVPVERSNRAAVCLGLALSADRIASRMCLRGAAGRPSGRRFPPVCHRVEIVGRPNLVTLSGCKVSADRIGSLCDESGRCVSLSGSTEMSHGVSG
jgi:hypothetical protein